MKLTSFNAGEENEKESEEKDALVPCHLAVFLIVDLSSEMGAQLDFISSLPY